jgi:hypothetical protein
MELKWMDVSKKYNKRSIGCFNTEKDTIEDSHTCRKRKSMGKRKVIGEGIKTGC